MTALRVLHVDDEPDIREVVEISLGLDPDFVTRGCGSGTEAIKVAAEWSPDVILLDVMMPGMDGPATLAGLRGNTQTAEIPVVFMTARAQSRELDLFRSLGAVGVIPKPFDPMTLATSVRGYIHTPDDRLVTLRNDFLKRVRSDAAVLAGHRSALEAGTAVQVALTGVVNIAHGLAGASGIFGFFEIGDAAAVLEEEASAALNASGKAGEIVPAVDRMLAIVEANRIFRTDRPRPWLDA